MNPFIYEERKKQIRIIDFKTKENSNLSDFDFKEDYLMMNSINLDLTENVYRIFNYEYFIKDLTDKKLTLVHPNLWDDPYENFFLNANGRTSEGELFTLEPIRNSYYCQCWSLNEECDGLWRNYKGNNEFAIQIKTNTKKLFDAIYDIHNTFHYLNYFIGKVEYVSNEEFIEYFKNKVHLNYFQSGIEFASTLLKKRIPFAYEKELRIIVKTNEGNDNTKDTYRINLDLNSIIEEIIFDPWISNDKFTEYSQKIKNNGFKGIIKKSNLYEIPNFEIKI